MYIGELDKSKKNTAVTAGRARTYFCQRRGRALEPYSWCHITTAANDHSHDVDVVSAASTVFLSPARVEMRGWGGLDQIKKMHARGHTFFRLVSTYRGRGRRR